MARKASMRPRGQATHKPVRQGPEPVPRSSGRGRLVPETRRRQRDATASGFDRDVTIAITEGLGTFWLAPRLIEFQRIHPDIVIILVCDMRLPDVRALSQGVAVQLVKPVDLDLAIVKLGRLHCMPFAAPAYVETYGAPATIEDARNHRVVLQFADQTATQELYDLLFPGVPQSGFVSVRTTTSSAHLSAIARGAGIGTLPTYVHAIAAPIVPIDVGLHFHFDIWLTYRPAMGRNPQVQRTIDWLIDSFDPNRFPWFRDEFIHPEDLMKNYRGAPLSSSFEGFLGKGR